MSKLSAEGTGNRRNSVGQWLGHGLDEWSVIRFVARPKRFRHSKASRLILDTTRTPEYPIQWKPGVISSGGVVKFDARFRLVRSCRLGDMPKYHCSVQSGGHENLELYQPLLCLSWKSWRPGELPLLFLVWRSWTLEDIPLLHSMEIMKIWRYTTAPYSMETMKTWRYTTAPSSMEIMKNWRYTTAPTSMEIMKTWRYTKIPLLRLVGRFRKLEDIPLPCVAWRSWRLGDIPLLRLVWRSWRLRSIPLLRLRSAR